MILGGDYRSLAVPGEGALLDWALQDVEATCRRVSCDARQHSLCGCGEEARLQRTAAAGETLEARPRRSDAPAPSAPPSLTCARVLASPSRIG